MADRHGTCVGRSAKLASRWWNEGSFAFVRSSTRTAFAPSGQEKCGSHQPSQQGFPALQYAAKLKVYCNFINNQLRGPDDQPTIGIIQCQSRNNILAQDAFTDIDKPIGVSTYDLTRSSPNDFKSALPTVEQIEAEIASLEKRRVKRQKSPRKKWLALRRGERRWRNGSRKSHDCGSDFGPPVITHDKRNRRYQFRLCTPPRPAAMNPSTCCESPNSSTTRRRSRRTRGSAGAKPCGLCCR